MVGLGIEIPGYDPKKYLSQVAIFEKRKADSEYDVTDADQDRIETKRPKLDFHKEEKLDVTIKEEDVNTCRTSSEKVLEDPTQ